LSLSRLKLFWWSWFAAYSAVVGEGDVEVSTATLPEVWSLFAACTAEFCEWRINCAARVAFPAINLHMEKRTRLIIYIFLLREKPLNKFRNANQ
jgi:hypothetical protein